MAYLVLAGFLVVIALVGLAWGLFSSIDKKPGFITAGVAVAILAIVTLIASITVVGARSVGVETAFGSYRGSIDHGTHLIAPWASVESFSTRLQVLDLGQNKAQNGATTEDAVDVSYAGNGGGNVVATVQWRTTDKEIGRLWSDYQTFEHVRDRVVGPKARTAINDVISQYTPVDARNGQNRVDMQNKATAALSTYLLPYGITVDSVTISRVNLDSTAQAAYNNIVTANANIQKATAEQTRAKIDAQTNQLRAVSLTPQALEKNCLDVTNAWNVHNNGPLPANWNCVGGSSLPLTVPAK